MKNTQEVKEHKSRTGAIRKPLFYSECKRFVFVNVKYKCGIELNKWYWSNHRLFKI